MNTKRKIKIVKRQEREAEQPLAVSTAADNSNIWSTAVRLWVSQYRRARDERLPAFDRLFKDVVSQSAEQPVSQTSSAG